jgi:Carboxypeptidase regulatory-like domain/TonB dependent receptor
MMNRSPLMLHPRRPFLHAANFLLITVLLLLMVRCSFLTAYGQSATATLSGTVQDQNGAVVAGANVTVLNAATSLRRQAATSEQGYFTIPLLPPGTYSLMAERQGFAPVKVPEVVLNVGDQKALQIQLKAGDVNAAVTVDSEATTVRTDGSVGTVVNRQFIANIPLNGRSLQSLISLTPGVVTIPVGPDPSSTGGQFSVNGQRTNANYFMVDGVSANYSIPSGTFIGESGSGALPGLTALGGTNSLISIDALQEFNIQTSSFAPEFGRMPGGQISLLSRSGTNDFHGTIFDYVRNAALDANDWFANRSGLPKPKERQNDFGGTFSGPILLPRFGEGGSQPWYNGRNRTFFFFSYEGLRLLQPLTSISTVPTTQARQQVPDVIKPFLNAYPSPNLPVVANGLAQFIASYSNPATLNATSIRIDNSLNQKMNLFGTYKHSPSQTQARANPLNRITSTTLKNDAVTVGLTWLVSSSMTNDLRFNWSRAGATQTNDLDSLGGAVVPDDSLLFTRPLNRNNSFTSWFAYNGASSGTLFADSTFIGSTGGQNAERQINLVDTFSLVKGAHQLKLGVDYRRISPILVSPQGQTVFLFDLLNPQPVLVLYQSARATPGDKAVVFNNFSAYAQDSWKANRRLTLTYGLRWELNPPPYSANGHHPSVLLGLDGPGPATLAPAGTRLYKTSYANFAPRFGVSYQLLNRPGRETVLRGGAGVFYDLGTGVLATEFSAVFPFFAARNYCCFNIPYPVDPSAFPAGALGVDPPTQFYVSDLNLKLPYTVQWNTTVEQSLGNNQTLTVSYVGSSGQRLLRLTQSGIPVAGFGPGRITYRLTRNDGWSNYRALQAQFQRRLSRGVQGLLSYTWAAAYDTASSDNGTNASSSNNGTTGTTSPLFGARQSYGPSDFDVRHNLSGALTIDIPAAKGPRAIKTMTKGWGVDGLFRFRTALPTNLTSFVVLGLDSLPARPNVVPGVPQILEGPQYPGGKAVNPAAFVAPSKNTQGNFQRNSLRFFNASQLDVAIRRQFSLTEALNLQFRFEFFNVLNHPNFADPTGFNPGSNVSTQILSRSLGGMSPLYQIGGPRSGQVALKLTF